MLLGRTGGKSAGALHPMLLLAGFCTVLLLFGIYLNKNNAFMVIACSAISLVGILMFLFDVHFTDKREFNFVVSSAQPQLGWWIGFLADVSPCRSKCVRQATVSSATISTTNSTRP